MIAGPLRLVAEAHPAVSIGSYPFNAPDGAFGSNLVARSEDPEALAAARAAIEALARDARRRGPLTRRFRGDGGDPGVAPGGPAALVHDTRR